MNNSMRVLASIDWAQLREQKLALLAMLTDYHPVTGIVNHLLTKSYAAHKALNDFYDLIDAIQDAAVADGLATKEAVFGSEEPT